MPPICLPDSRLATLMRLPSRYSRSAATRPFACFRMSRVPSVEHSGVSPCVLPVEHRVLVLIFSLILIRNDSSS
jgi:hypothetical protein